MQEADRSGKEFSLKTADNLDLYIKSWNCQNPIAQIILIHGLGEHINRYEHVAEFYNQRSISLVGIDLRGHGRSAGKKGYTPSYEHLLNDIELFITEYSKPDLPKILYGHSMGGNLVLNYLTIRSDDFKASIVTAPWIKLFKEPGPAIKMAAKCLNFIGGFSNGNKLDSSVLATDPEVGLTYDSDEYVHDRIHSKLALGVMNAGEFLLNTSKNITCPLLIMHGDQDKITSNAASRKFAERHKGEIHFKNWPGLYHEIHNGLQKEAVLKYSFDWIEKKL